MTEPTAPAPRTAAGRRLLATMQSDSWAGAGPEWFLNPILAIEAEAATPTVEQSGPLDVDALRRAARISGVHLEGGVWLQIAAEYARLVPSPAQPADTALADLVRETLEKELRSIEALSEHPDSRYHTEQTPTGGGHSWRCIPIVEAVEAAVLAAQPTSSEQDR